MNTFRYANLGFSCCTKSLGAFPITVNGTGTPQTIDASQLFTAQYLNSFTAHSANLLVTLLNTSQAVVTADGAVAADPKLTGSYMILAPAGSVDPAAYQQLYATGVIGALPSLQIQAADWSVFNLSSAPSEVLVTPAAGASAASLPAPAQAPAAATVAAWFTPAFASLRTASSLQGLAGLLASGTALVYDDGSIRGSGAPHSILAPSGSVQVAAYQAQTGKLPASSQTLAGGLNSLVSNAGTLATGIAAITSLFSGGGQSVTTAPAPVLGSLAPPPPPPPPPSFSGGAVAPVLPSFNLVAPPAPPPVPPVFNFQAPAPPPVSAAPTTAGGLSASDVLAIVAANNAAQAPRSAAPPVAPAGASPLVKYGLIAAAGVLGFILLRPRGRR